MKGTNRGIKRRLQSSPDSIAADQLSFDGTRQSSFYESADGVMYVDLSDSAIAAMGTMDELSDPVLAMNFHGDRLAAGLNAVNNLPVDGRPALPEWMPGAAYPITIEAFKLFVMNCCAQASNGGVVDSFIIAPNTNFEFSKILTRIGLICRNPFILAVANGAQGYLARVYGIQESNRRAVATAADIDHFELPPGTIAAFV